MATSPFETPARRPRRSSSSSASNRGSLLGSGVESELTPSGAQILHAGLRRSGRALALQVLGIYRYAADPLLVRQLPARAAAMLDRDAFDLVVSDGQMKMKALLAPALNDLVWRGQLTDLDVVEIDDYEVVTLDASVGNDDDDVADQAAASRGTQRARSVCILHDLTPRAQPSAADAGFAPRAKIVYSTGSALLASPSQSQSSSTASAAVPELQFISETHIRDHGALPLAGGRLYYLSLFSDDYPADWEPVPREPLAPVTQAVPWAEWNRRRRYCTDIFSAGDRVVHTIREVNVITSKRNKRTASEMMEEDSQEDGKTAVAPPPMVGIVQFKSGLTHLGDRAVANPFPFIFHIVICDHERAVEVAFFGSMTAKNFLIVQEGDVIQLQGYSVGRSEARGAGDKPKKLFYLPHLSAGVVSHVPDKYWCFLEVASVLPLRPSSVIDSKDGEDAQRQTPPTPADLSTVWLEPTFISTRYAHQWDDKARETLAVTYFDFVGVVSFVGRMHRRRPRPDASVESLEAYRWIKVIDTSSPHELVVRLRVNSQPTAFHAIQAGDAVMLSKLQWVDARKSDTGLEFAMTSVFTTIRLNDDLEPFHEFSECLEVCEFAKDLQSSGDARTQYSAVDSPLVATTESWLEGPGVRDFQPLYESPSMAETKAEGLLLLDEEASLRLRLGGVKNHWVPEFNPRMSIASTEYTDGIGYSFSFKEVTAICESMEALSHRYLRVYVALHDVRVAPATAHSAAPEIEFLVTDAELQSGAPQPIRLRSNLLFQEQDVPSPLDEIVTPEAEPLVRLLSPSVIKSLNTAAILHSTELPQFSPAASLPAASFEPSQQEQEVTLEAVKDYILKNRQVSEGGRVGGIDVALHVYRLPHGELDLWIDAMSL